MRTRSQERYTTHRKHARWSPRSNDSESGVDSTVQELFAGTLLVLPFDEEAGPLS